MTPEDRLYAALDGRRPDRIPSLSLLADPNIINQVLGRKPGPILPFLKSERGARLIERYGGFISSRYREGIWLFESAVARMNFLLGFDGVFLMNWPGRLLDSLHVEDGLGRLFDIVDDGYGNPYIMYREGLIRDPADWRTYRRVGIIDYASTFARLYRLWRLRWNRKICVIPFVAPGLWENSWQPMGFERFAVLLRRDPAFVREVIGYFTAQSVATVDACCRAGARVIAYGDDLAYKSGPMVSPRVLDDFYAEGMRQITAAAHRHGARILIHCCGNTNELVERFVEWGFDGAHAFEPTAMNDLKTAREKAGDKLCLVGNIDVTRILVDASREEVEEEVRKAVRDAAGGGFILAPAHTHAGLSAERVRWMLEAAESIPYP